MSAQLRPAATPPQAVRNPDSETDSADDAALGAWLRRELGRLYDAALTEPLPEALTALLDAGRQDRR